MDGLVVPAGAVVLDVSVEPPLTHVDAYVTKTPPMVRAELEGRRDLEVVTAEDEGYEAELLVSDGTRKSFVTANAVCRDASRLSIVMAQAGASDKTGAP